MRVTLIQPNSGNDLTANIAFVEERVRQAAQSGADIVTMPENVFMMPGNAQELFGAALPEEAHLGVTRMRELAAAHNIWIHVGGVAVASPHALDKCLNRTILINANGDIAARYDKIHLYDAAPEGGESHTESARFAPGNRAVTVRAPFGHIGLTICYDLRFPLLFRKMAQAGAAVIFAPAAFTAYTGAKHWEILLRARAIETGCFIVAAAQVGKHPAERRTFGHGLVVSPWGDVVTDMQDKIGAETVSLDLEEAARYRAQIPSITLDPAYDFDVIDAR